MIRASFSWKSGERSQTTKKKYRYIFHPRTFDSLPLCIPLPFGRNFHDYLSGYRPVTFTRMFETRHSILSNVRTNVRMYQPSFRWIWQKIAENNEPASLFMHSRLCIALKIIELSEFSPVDALPAFLNLVTPPDCVCNFFFVVAA